MNSLDTQCCQCSKPKIGMIHQLSLRKYSLETITLHDCITVNRHHRLWIHKWNHYCDFIVYHLWWHLLITLHHRLTGENAYRKTLWFCISPVLLVKLQYESIIFLFCFLSSRTYMLKLRKVQFVWGNLSVRSSTICTEFYFRIIHLA
jgi:hypothetical protein